MVRCFQEGAVIFIIPVRLQVDVEGILVEFLARGAGEIKINQVLEVEPEAHVAQR